VGGEIQNAEHDRPSVGGGGGRKRIKKHWNDIFGSKEKSGEESWSKGGGGLKNNSAPMGRKKEGCFAYQQMDRHGGGCKGNNKLTNPIKET